MTPLYHIPNKWWHIHKKLCTKQGEKKIQNICHLQAKWKREKNTYKRVLQHTSIKHKHSIRHAQRSAVNMWASGEYESKEKRGKNSRTATTATTTEQKTAERLGVHWTFGMMRSSQIYIYRTHVVHVLFCISSIRHGDMMMLYLYANAFCFFQLYLLYWEVQKNIGYLWLVLCAVIVVRLMPQQIDKHVNYFV